MTTSSQTTTINPQDPDTFADAWAAVFIDIYEKLKANGELPNDEDNQLEQGDDS